MTDPGWQLPGYDIGVCLGFGASAEVWAATELATGEPVALKRLRPRPTRAMDRLRGAPIAPLDLLREADLLMVFRHPHVIALRRVVDSESGPVLVLDRAAGGSLATLLSVRRHLDPGELVTTAVPIAEALAAAHASGLVHGDVTPANVLYLATGQPVLADLGIARLVGQPVGDVDGSAEYLDPAVARGGDPDPAADVFGLAAVCFHALAGRGPWRAESAQAALTLAAGGLHDPLERLAPQAPAALVAAVEAALVADPALRPDAAGFAHSLRRAAAAAPVRLLVAVGPGTVAAPGRPVAPYAGLLRPPGTPSTEAGADVGVLTGRPVEAAAVTHPVRRRSSRRQAGARRRRRPLRTTLASRPVQLAMALPLVLAAGIASAELARHRTDGTPVAVAPATAAASAVPAGGAGGATPTTGPVPTAEAALPTPTPRVVPTALLIPYTADAAGWKLALEALDMTRSEAFDSGNVALLGEVYAVGSEPWLEDVTAMRALVAAGTTASSLRLEVQSVTVETATPQRVVLRIVDVLPSYEIVDRTGRVVAVRAGRGATDFRVALIPSSRGWRTAQVERVVPDQASATPSPSVS